MGTRRDQPSPSSRRASAPDRADAAVAHGAGDAAWLVADVFQHVRDFFFAHAGVLELHPRHAQLLRALTPGEPKPMGELAAVLHCDASTATQLVDRLEDRGLVARRPDPRDRRVRSVALTAAGTRTRTRLMDALGEGPPLLARLSDAERADLCRVLTAALGHAHGAAEAAPDVSSAGGRRRSAGAR